MPTGYTSFIEEGISFKDFVMICSRNFGALVMMRDAPMDAKIPEKFEPSSYYADCLKEAIRNYEIFSKMTPSYAKSLMDEEILNYRKRYEQIKKEKIELEEKYIDMLNKVMAWEPPTPDHEELKKFMIDQIKESIKFDCHYSSIEIFNNILYSYPKTAEEWLEKKILHYKNKIASCEKNLKEDIERTEKRNLWIQQLRDSLE